MMFLLLFFQVVIGLVIGFYFTDKKRGISFKEIKFGIIVMMLTTSVLLFTSHSVSLHTVVITAFSALVLFGSIFAGEVLHMKIIEAVLKGIEKENIHATVRQFVERAKLAAQASPGTYKELMDAELYRTVTHLKTLSERAKCFKQRELASQIKQVSDSCVALSRLSVKMNNPESYRRYERLADQLLDISWDTLICTEYNIQCNLSKSWKTVAFAMKTVHMK